MANYIAVIWDFDKTLVNGYMQDPIFKEYHVDSGQFWAEVNSLPEKYEKEQHIKVNKDTIYLNHFIHYVHKGIFKGLNNAKLRKYGKELEFYKGIPEIFEKSKKVIADNSKYDEFGIKVEHYVVSTGMAEIIRGSKIMDYVEAIWGCELIESEKNGEKEISEIGYTIDNTTKTRAIFEINKGIPKRKELDVNSKIPAHLRRIHFENMIYIADGPSDIPAFSVINQCGGATFVIYPKSKKEEFKQVERMRADGRINMYAEADYSEGTTAYMWIINKIEEFAERLYKAEKDKLQSASSSVPHHITE